LADKFWLFLFSSLPAHCCEHAVNRFPEFYLVAFGIKDVDKFAVIKCFNAVEDGNTACPEISHQAFDILHAVVDHKFLFGRAEIFTPGFERAPLQVIDLFGPVGISELKTGAPFIGFKPKFAGIPVFQFGRIIREKENAANAGYFWCGIVGG
jgi:hypothetical protein